MKLNKVAHARKDPGECGKCGLSIKKGDPYVWWQMFRGPKYIRHDQTQCHPKQSELQSNDVLQAAYTITEEDIPLSETFDEFEELCKEYAERIRDEVTQVAREKMESLEESWPNAYESMAAYETNQQFEQDSEAWADEVEQVSHDYSDEEYNAEEARDALVEAISNCPL